MSTLLAQVDLEKAFLLNPKGDTVADTFANPAALINIILPNLLVFAGVLLFIFTVAAGFKMVMSPSGQKEPGRGQKADQLRVGGFVLLFISYWIAQIVENFLGISILGGTP